MNEDIWNNLGELKQMKIDYDQEEGERIMKAEREKEETTKKIMQEREKFLKEENERKERKKENLCKLITKNFGDYTECVFDGKSFFFCQRGFEKFKKELDKKNFVISILDGYLYRDYIDTEKNIKKFTESIEENKDISNQKINIYGRSIHRLIKIEEVEELSRKIGCSIEDIHVHHIDEEPTNNRLSNLEVLHKDEHAKKHGFDTWEKLQEDRKKRGLSLEID